MILEKAAVLALSLAGSIAVANQTVGWLEQIGLSQPFAVLATVAVGVTSTAVLWRAGVRACRIMLKVGRAADHVMDQPERDAAIKVELQELRAEMQRRFERLEKFLETRLVGEKPKPPRS